MNLLLLLTEGMSLKKWNELGQLSRELNIYQKLAEEIGCVYIHSYGKNESKYLTNYPNLRVLDKPWFIPDWEYIPSKIKRIIINSFYRNTELIVRKKILRSIQIIKTNQFSDLKFADSLKTKFGAKLIIRMGYYHTIDKSRFDNEKQYFDQINLETKYFNTCDCIIVTNFEAYEFIKKKYNLANDKVFYIPNYIDTDFFKPLGLIKEYDILFVGRLSKEKSLEELLNAFKDNDLKILFIGSGPIKERLIEHAKKNGLNLTILERIDNLKLAEYYNRSKIFLLPSRYESNPKVLLEAMACGCICIGSNVKGIREIIENGRNGYLFNNAGAELVSLIRTSLEKYNNLGAIKISAQLFVQKNNALILNIKNEVEILKNIYGH